MGKIQMQTPLVEMDGDEMADFSKRFSFLQSVALVVLGLVLFVNLIIFMLPDRKKRGRKKR